MHTELDITTHRFGSFEKPIVRAFLWLLVFNFSSNSFAQITFNTIHPPGNNEPNLIIQDSAYVVLQQGNPEIDQLHKVYFDEQGTYLKTDTIQLLAFFEDCKGCVKTFSGGYLKAGTYFYNNDSAEAVLVKLDKNLDSIQTVTYSLFNEVSSDVYSLLQIDSLGVILVGQYYKKSSSSYWMFMTMFDYNLNVIWERFYKVFNGNQPGGITATNVVQTSDGGFMIGGYAELVSTNRQAGIILKTDSVGNEEWRESINAMTTNNEVLLLDMDNGYVLFATASCNDRDSISNELICQPRVGVIDYNGNVVLDRRIGQRGLNLTVDYLTKTSDFNYLIGGYNQSLGFTSYAMKMTGSGDSIWHRQFRYANHQFPNEGRLQSVSLTNDSGYVYTCYFIDLGPGGTGVNTWLVKTDKFGCIQNGCQNIGIRQQDENKLLFSVFPNPASDFVLIKSDQESFDFHVFDLAGKKIKAGMSRKDIFRLDVSDLNDGVYFIEVRSEIATQYLTLAVD